MDGLNDEWDESFIDELIRFHDEDVALRNPNPTPAPFDPFATAAVSYLPAAASYPHTSSSALPLSHIAAAPHASSTASAVCFSPPRELTQRPPLPPPAAVAASGSEMLALVPAVGCGFSPPRELSQRPAAEESACEIVGVAGLAGVDRFRGGAVRWERDAREAERREVERLKKELNRVSKQMNDLVLSDPEKRAIYDQYGEEGLKRMPPPGSQSRTFTAAGPSGPSNFRYNPSDTDDFFAEFMVNNKPYSFDQDRMRFQPRSH